MQDSGSEIGRNRRVEGLETLSPELLSRIDDGLPTRRPRGRPYKDPNKTREFNLPTSKIKC